MWRLKCGMFCVRGLRGWWLWGQFASVGLMVERKRSRAPDGCVLFEPLGWLVMAFLGYGKMAYIRFDRFS